MKPLKLRPATQLIAGIQTPCYGIYCGEQLLRLVSVFHYAETLKIVCRANEVIEMRAKAMVKKAIHEAAAKQALHLCGSLGESRARLTKQTIIAANKARKLGN